MRTHAQLKSWKRCKCAEIGQLCPSFTLCLVVPCLLPNCSEEAAGPGSLVGVTPPSYQKATRTCRCHLDRLGWDRWGPSSAWEASQGIFHPRRESSQGGFIPCTALSGTAQGLLPVWHPEQTWKQAEKQEFINISITAIFLQSGYICGCYWFSLPTNR